MKESKKSIIRKIYFFLMKSICITGILIGYFLCPVLKLLGYYPCMSWPQAWMPALIVTGVQLVWLFGWFSVWILKEGEK